MMIRTSFLGFRGFADYAPQVDGISGKFYTKRLTLTPMA